MRGLTLRDPAFLPYVDTGFPWPSGLQVHSSADAITGKSEGDSLTGWTDLSSNARHWGVAGAGSPKYRATAGPASLPAVEVGAEGSDGYFTAGAGLLAALPSAVDCFLVVKGGGGNAGMWNFSTAGNSSHYRYLGANNIYETFGQDNRINNSPPVVLADWHLYEVESVSGNQVCRLDGTSRITGSSGYGMANGKLGDGQGFGCSDFQFAEIVIFDRVLDGTERDLVEGYFATKYGLSIA